MGEFTGTPEVTKRMNFSSDTEPKDVDTSTETNTETETDTQGAEAGKETATGTETAAQAQGTQTSQQTSAEVEGDDKKPETKAPATPKKRYGTDVTGVMCDDQVRIGTDKFPCFDVSHQEFYQNMQDGRRRLRFSQGSDVQKYMQGTKYNRPFFIRHTDEKGKTYVRKIK